jgi:hypothetical protein
VVLCVALFSSFFALSLAFAEDSCSDCHSSVVVGIFTIWGTNVAAVVAGLVTLRVLDRTDSRRGPLLVGIVAIQLIVDVAVFSWPY